MRAESNGATVDPYTTSGAFLLFRVARFPRPASLFKGVIGYV